MVEVVMWWCREWLRGATAGAEVRCVGGGGRGRRGNREVVEGVAA